MRIRPLLAPFIAAAVVSIAGCGSDDDGSSLDHLKTIVTADDGAVSVEMLAEADLSVGRNLVWYRVTDTASGDLITDATVTQSPIMDMMSFSHSCPEVDPPAAANDDGVYPGTIVFIMPTSAEGTWKDELTVVRAGEATEHVITLANLAVADADRRKTFDVMAGEMAVKHFVTLNEQAPWAQGSNDYVLTVHKRESMMSFPALDDVLVSVTITPDGGATTTATAPTHDTNGEYMGSLELAAPGVYTITFTITRGSDDLGVVSWQRTI